MKSSLKRVLISVDIEGMEGVVSKLQIARSESDFTQARKRLAKDVNAAICACYDSGFEEVVVCDSHADMENLILEELDSRAKLISGAMRSSLQVQTIEEGYDALIIFGHSGAGHYGVLDHSFNGRKIYNIRLNNQQMNTEALVNAAIAGVYNVPLVAVIGDDQFVNHVKDHISTVETIEVKRCLSRYCAISVHPDVARECIYNGVKAALERLNTMLLLKLEEPVVLEVDFKETSMVQTAELVPGVRVLSPRTVQFTGDAKTVFNVLTLLAFRLVDDL